VACCPCCCKKRKDKVKIAGKMSTEESTKEKGQPVAKVKK
jgi:hypothetical protein